MGEKETATAADAERSVIKTKTKSNQSNDRMAGDDGDDLDDDGAAINSDGAISHEDDWNANAAKLAPEKPVKSEIAIGDPGVNGNLAVSDPAVATATPKKSN